MAIEQYANLAQSILVGGISATATTLQVGALSSFPTAPQFRLVVDQEIMLVTAVAGTTFTVTRGAEGTAPAPHANGAVAACVLTAASLAAAVSQAVGWQTALDFDWTQGTSQSFNNDGAVSFGGQTFTKINSANEATHASAGGGAGLSIGVNNATAFQFAAGKRSGPGLFLPFSALGISSLSFRTPLRVWTEVTAAGSTDSDGLAGVATVVAHSSQISTLGNLLAYISVVQDQHPSFTNFAFHSEVILAEAIAADGGGGNNIAGAFPQPITSLLELPLGIVGGYVVQSVATTSSAWPAYTALTPIQNAQYFPASGNSMAVPGVNASGALSGNTPGQWGVLLAVNGAASTAITGTVTRFRVDYFAGAT